MTVTSNKLFLTNANSEEQNIVFIDRQVSDYQNLVAGIKPQTKVVLLDPEADGIEEMTKYLLGGKYKSVHVVSHGSAGSLQLGSSQLNSGNLDTYKSQLQQWKTALTEDADILLYGCDVAIGEIGVSFVQQLSQLTGADVAASDNLTGNVGLGGDWKLEVSAGMIEAPLAFQAGVMEAYNSILATTISTPVATINNPSPTAGELFGFSLAIANNNILIGAPKANGEKGEAYRFDINGLLQQTFNNPSGIVGEKFGLAVATNGTDFLVGAPESDDAIADVGRAYRFNANGALQQTFNNSVNNDDSEFGTAITILSNGNYVIGAPEKGKTQATDNAGQVRLFDNSGIFIGDITNPGTGFIQDARFGFAVAAAGNDIIIGAPGFGTSGFNFGIGQAYRYDTTGSLKQIFTNPNPTVGFLQPDFFGISVASNSDGTRVLIGASGEDIGAKNAGVAYLYDITTAIPTLLRTFTNPDTSKLGFGSSLAFVGNDILIGAPGDFDVSSGKPTPIPGNGAVYLFDGDGASPTYNLERIFSNPNTGNDSFGAAISVLDNNTIAISAPYYDEGSNTDAGIAYIFNITPPVNDRPTFSIGGNQSVKVGTGQVSITGWAYNFNAGATDESGQGIAKYIIEISNNSNSNPNIFAVAPQIDLSTGTLIYTPSTTTGTAQIKVQVQDNGGTANGGVDTSVAQTFTITVNATTTNSIKATPNPDTLTGTDQSDRISALDGDDSMFAGLGSDRIFGGNGNDILYGDLGVNLDNSDIMPAYGSAFTMNDTIGGGAGNDKIYGNLGDDKLYGDEGNDEIWGGNGDDEIWGGAGDDSLWGGAGKDTFVLVRGQGKDTISDFKINEDKIAGAGGIKTFESLLITQLGTDTLITDKARNQDLAVLTGINKNSLNNSHFLAF